MLASKNLEYNNMSSYWCMKNHPMHSQQDILGFLLTALTDGPKQVVAKLNSSARYLRNIFKIQILRPQS